MKRRNSEEIVLIDTADLRRGDEIRGIGYEDGDGTIVTYHVTGNPARVIAAIRGKAKLMSTYGPHGKHAELGPGVYTSAHPQLWMGRVRGGDPVVLALRVKGLLAWLDRSRPDPKLLRLLRKSGVVGCFTKISMGSNPEMVIWDSRAIKSVEVQ